MRQRFFLFAYFLFLMMHAGAADVDIDQQDIGSESIDQPAKRTPFHFNTHLDVIGTSKITKGIYKEDKIQFAEADIEAGAIFYYCPRYTEGAMASLSFTPTYLRWNQNPWFDQDHFNILSLSLAGFSKRIDCWFWRSQITVNFNTDNWSSKYTSYDLLLWGRYTYSRHIGLHFGFLAQTGLRLDRIYPLLGFDWQISPRWKLNLIYPVNLSLVYSLNSRWSIAVAGRFFNSRFRVNHREHALKPLVRYTNAGAELILAYENQNMSANIHAGTTLGGIFRVADRSNHHAKNYHIGAAAYAGGEIDIKF